MLPQSEERTVRPTPDQYTYLSSAVRNAGHLRQPHTIETRMWMTAMVQMNKKGYIRWDGPRPYISEAGLRALDCYVGDFNIGRHSAASACSGVQT